MSRILSTSFIIDAKLEVGCYTCIKRATCERLARMGLGIERTQRTREGSRVAVSGEPHHPIGAYCLEWTDDMSNVCI